MRLSLAILCAVSVHGLDEKKVPPRHPIQRLNRLVQFTDEILGTWFDFLPAQASWKAKFRNNAKRMENAFTRDNSRCGFYDDEQLPHGGPEQRLVFEYFLDYKLVP